MRLLVDNADAERLVASIPHRTCVDASENNWIVSDQGNAKAQSVLWLFCWGKTGMGSREACGLPGKCSTAFFPSSSLSLMHWSITNGRAPTDTRTSTRKRN
jgi:hypothetical protein